MTDHNPKMELEDSEHPIVYQQPSVDENGNQSDSHVEMQTNNNNNFSTDNILQSYLPNLDALNQELNNINLDTISSPTLVFNDS